MFFDKERPASLVPGGSVGATPLPMVKESKESSPAEISLVESGSHDGTKLPSLHGDDDDEGYFNL